MLVIAAVAFFATRGGDDEPAFDESCDPEAPFERPLPRGFAYAPAPDSAADTIIRNVREQDDEASDEFGRDDLATRQVTPPDGPPAFAFSVRVPKGEGPAELQRALTSDPEARTREVELRDGPATRVEFAGGGGTAVVYLRIEGCLVLAVEGFGEPGMRRIAEAVLAAG